MPSVSSINRLRLAAGDRVLIVGAGTGLDLEFPRARGRHRDRHHAGHAENWNAAPRDANRSDRQLAF